jgi:hypothetical protein
MANFNNKVDRSYSLAVLFSPFSARVSPLIFILMYSAVCRNFVFLFSFFLFPPLASEAGHQKLTEKEKREIEVDELDNLIGFFHAFSSSSFPQPPTLVRFRALYNFHFIKVRQKFFNAARTRQIMFCWFGGWDEF